MAMADPLYARLNNKGKKQFRKLDRQTFIEHFADYANLGLPAHKAALDGNVECLKECFCSFSEEGVPSRDVNGATPLHLAVRNNHADAVKWLLRFTDLSPSVSAKHKETPAHVAAAQGHLESLKQLLAAEGKGDFKSNLATAVDNSGFSVLHLAIVKHRNDCAKLLINELGSKAISALNESGVTAVHLAASAGNVEVLRFLSTKYKKLLNQGDKEEASPVYYAAQEGRLEALEFLHEKCKCDLSCACGDGLKPIHAASQCGNTNIIKYIVSRLGNQAIFDTTPDGATPLHFATSAGQIYTAQWLVNSDAGGMLVGKKDRNGDTPAHDAAENGNVPMLKFLLENGADLYAINNDGNTPYSLALSGGNMDTANFVMTYASKAPQRDSGGPVRIYNMQGEVDVVEVNKSSELSGTPPPSTSLNSTLQSSTEVKGKKESLKKDKKKSKKAQKENSRVEETNLKSSNSFLESTAQTLQSFNQATVSVTKEFSDTDLAISEDELAMFSKNHLAEGSREDPDEHIVVSYTGPQAMNPLMMMDEPAGPGYATVNEIIKKGKKEEHKVSKSIVNPEKGITSASSHQTAFSGPEVGFKPQLRTNPLQRLGGSIPPTPPPTPATAASIAPSDETPQYNMEDVEEVDDNSFDPYSVPDPKVVSKKVERRKMEEQNMLKSSENQKLLKDVLQDLSGDETPPEIQKQRLNGAEEDGKIQSLVSVGSQGRGQSGGSEHSLKTSSKTKAEPETDSPELKQVNLKPVGERLGTQINSDDVKSRFPVLKKVKRDTASRDTGDTELSKIKLKKTRDWKRAEFSHPETETTSGATNELKDILKKKVVY